ncbi:FecR domain-containing protein [Novosphingobium sp. CF614]|uniref:FecR family protein n=1 Tax=Novosphingobium sp. CF614 TaxID=1884364 RepID=UPI0015A6FD76|nr:FecR domain-containing protein [Novosphingobium sp. CF614]
MNRETESDLPEALLLEAAQWHLRCEDPRDDAMDWDAFSDWLGADPRHRRALDQMTLTADTIDEHRATLIEDEEEVAPPAPGARRFWRWGGLAIAASLAAVVAVPQLMGPTPEVYATDAQARRVALADGSSVMLAPHSRLTVEGRSQDNMSLEGGALFNIRHDPSRTLTISAGDVSVSDIGTRFDVQQQDSAVRVAVAEGRVRVSSQAMAQSVGLAAGDGLTFDGAVGTATVAPVKVQEIGSWQNGRLTYDNASLALVAADLSRYAGVKVEVPAALRFRRFSGTLIVDDGEKALRDLVELMDLRLGRDAGAWRIEQR